MGQAWIFNVSPFNIWAGLGLSDAKPLAQLGPTRIKSSCNLVNALFAILSLLHWFEGFSQGLKTYQVLD